MLTRVSCQNITYNEGESSLKTRHCNVAVFSTFCKYCSLTAISAALTDLFLKGDDEIHIPIDKLHSGQVIALLLLRTKCPKTF